MRYFLEGHDDVALSADEIMRLLKAKDLSPFSKIRRETEQTFSLIGLFAEFQDAEEAKAQADNQAKLAVRRAARAQMIISAMTGLSLAGALIAREMNHVNSAPAITMFGVVALVAFGCSFLVGLIRYFLA